MYNQFEVVEMELMSEKDIAQSIKEKLSQIEEHENVRIIYACESGSRAWGFASPDSDYDVRFIFVRPLQDYLRVKEVPDFIEAELNEIYDINGWDLKKFFKQLFKSNPVIFEWANSPIVYKTSDDWEKVKAVMNDYICKRSMIHHYLGLAKSTMKKYLTGETITYKKYFYILRAVLAASWVFYNESPAPTEYTKLLSAEKERYSQGLNHFAEKTFEELLNDLHKKKSLGSEKSRVKRNLPLENFIDSRMATLAGESSDLEKQVFTWEKLDELFQSIVQAGVNECDRREGSIFNGRN